MGNQSQPDARVRKDLGLPERYDAGPPHRQRRNGVGVVRPRPRARPQRRDQAARGAIRRRRGRKRAVPSRGARGCPAIRPPQRGDDLRRRRDRRRRTRASSSWSSSPAARSPTRSESTRFGGCTPSDGSGRPHPRSTSPTAAAFCIATSSPPTCCCPGRARCTWPTSESPGSAQRTRSPAPARCSEPPRISPPSGRSGSPRPSASDRYSLAVAAFELLVGERPFTAPHFAAQARQHVEEEPPAASMLQPGAARVSRRGAGSRHGQTPRAALAVRAGFRPGARDRAHGRDDQDPPSDRRRSGRAPRPGVASDGFAATGHLAATDGFAPADRDEARRATDRRAPADGRAPRAGAPSRAGPGARRARARSRRRGRDRRHAWQRRTLPPAVCERPATGVRGHA